MGAFEDGKIHGMGWFKNKLRPLFRYRYAWKGNTKRRELYNLHCRVVERWRNSQLVEFEDGQREVISGNALRKERE